MDQNPLEKLGQSRGLVRYHLRRGHVAASLTVLSGRPTIF